MKFDEFFVSTRNNLSHFSFVFRMKWHDFKNFQIYFQIKNQIYRSKEKWATSNSRWRVWFWAEREDKINQQIWRSYLWRRVLSESDWKGIPAAVRCCHWSAAICRAWSDRAAWKQRSNVIPPELIINYDCNLVVERVSSEICWDVIFHILRDLWTILCNKSILAALKLESGWLLLTHNILHQM